MRQVELDFEAGLTRQYEQFMDVCRAVAYGCGRPLKTVAAHMDLSQSELSRKLAENPNDPRHLNACEIPLLIEAAGERGKDLIYWLIERYLEDDKTRRERAVDLLLQMAPQFAALMSQVMPEAQEQRPKVEAVK